MSQFQISHGYVVLAIPENGLFVHRGGLVTGKGNPVTANDVVPLFSNRTDADQHAANCSKSWAEKGKHDWNFVVLPLVVKEK